VERILCAAARVLAHNRGAGMAEVAAAAGVARATLYRHFPSRDELVATIRTQAYDDFEATIAHARLNEGTALEAVRRLIEGIIEVGDHYLFLLGETPGETKGDPTTKRIERMRKPVLVLIERGQDSGEFSPDLPAKWATRMLAGLIGEALRSIAQGEMKLSEAEETVYRTFLRGFSPASA
jgi:TetR/AcrR family transcriptional repressor of mexCD-oprJ operon